LLDKQSCASALGAAQGLTHVFYTARAEFGEGSVEDVDRNVAMLRNVLDAAEAAPGLEHVHLIEGQKWYDVRLRMIRTPTREEDPRGPSPNFYFDQEDLLRERQAKRDWAWSASRPHFVYDFSPERPRNIVSTIGAWAAMCIERRTPLDFPGTPGCYSAQFEITDATLLACAVAWMASSGKARNQAYNVTDGCRFLWESLWPRFAAHFNLPLGQVRPRKLADSMPPHALASWPFADFLWSLDHDNTADTTKLRLHGFHGVVDTTEQILGYLRHYRELGLLP
jgi:nucleoside-diphosphate-sugar epimerase